MRPLASFAAVVASCVLAILSLVVLAMLARTKQVCADNRASAHTNVAVLPFHIKTPSFSLAQLLDASRPVKNVRPLRHRKQRGAKVHE